MWIKMFYRPGKGDYGEQNLEKSCIRDGKLLKTG
jgi:hypothetical protein